MLSAIDLPVARTHNVILESYHEEVSLWGCVKLFCVHRNMDLLFVDGIGSPIKSANDERDMSANDGDDKSANDGWV